MKFVYSYPETTGSETDMLDSGPIPQVAAAAEAAGFDGFSLTEHPAPSARWLGAGGHQTLDPFVALGAAGAVTGRIRLITHLAVAPYRNPMLLAKAAATVDRISEGRMTLGLGAGYHRPEFGALGVDMEERNSLFDEVLDVLPLHWSGRPFSYSGRHFQAKEIIGRPVPAQAPIPVWIGGNSRLSRRRVAERAQGWMPMLGSAELSRTTRTTRIASVDELAPLIAEVRTAAAELGRGEEIDVLCSYPDLSIESAPASDAGRHRDAFARIAESGVTWLIVSSTTHSSRDTLGFLETFGATYLDRP